MVTPTRCRPGGRPDWHKHLSISMNRLNKWAKLEATKRSFSHLSHDSRPAAARVRHVSLYVTCSASQNFVGSTGSNPNGLLLGHALSGAFRLVYQRLARPPPSE